VQSRDRNGRQIAVFVRRCLRTVGDCRGLTGRGGEDAEPPGGTALEAGKYLKQIHPQSKVSIRDIRDDTVTVIDGAKIVALDLAAARTIAKR
jgi:hypothetical protein